MALEVCQSAISTVMPPKANAQLCAVFLEANTQVQASPSRAGHSSSQRSTQTWSAADNASPYSAGSCQAKSQHAAHRHRLQVRPGSARQGATRQFCLSENSHRQLALDDGRTALRQIETQAVEARNPSRLRADVVVGQTRRSVTIQWKLSAATRPQTNQFAVAGAS